MVSFLRFCIVASFWGSWLLVSVSAQQSIPQQDTPSSEKPKTSADLQAADQDALSRLQKLIGQWRGVGQPRRGSTRGAWTEQATWAWNFSEGRAALVFEAPQAKYLQSGRLTPEPKSDQFRLVAKTPQQETPLQYTGTLSQQGVLTMKADAAVDGLPARLTLRTVARGKRLVILYEKALGGTGRFTRLAEVGYTKKGSGFGQGQSYTQCVVTGGLADRFVEYQGKKYPICCEGCRDLFEMDPEGVLAEYRQRLQEQKKKRQGE